MTVDGYGDLGLEPAPPQRSNNATRPPDVDAACATTYRFAEAFNTERIKIAGVDEGTAVRIAAASKSLASRWWPSKGYEEESVQGP